MAYSHVRRDVELKTTVDIAQDAFALLLRRPLPVLQQQQLRQPLGPRLLRLRVRLVTHTGVAPLVGGDVVYFHVCRDAYLKPTVNIAHDAFALLPRRRPQVKLTLLTQ